MTKLITEYVKVADLLRYEGNSKFHPESQIEELMGLITRFGFLIPILANRGNRTIIAGDGRIQAAQRLGMEEVPVNFIDHLSEREIQAFVISDNKIAEKGQWDMEKLAAEVQAIVLSDFDVKLTGLDEQTIDALLKDDDSFLPKETKKKAVVKSSGTTEYERNNGEVAFGSRIVKIKFKDSKQLQEAEPELKKFLSQFDGVEYSVVLR